MLRTNKSGKRDDDGAKVHTSWASLVLRRPHSALLFFLLFVVPALCVTAVVLTGTTTTPLSVSFSSASIQLAASLLRNADTGQVLSPVPFSGDLQVSWSTTRVRCRVFSRCTNARNNRKARNDPSMSALAADYMVCDRGWDVWLVRFRTLFHSLTQQTGE